jgi:hypothetical protein
LTKSALSVVDASLFWRAPNSIIGLSMNAMESDAINSAFNDWLASAAFSARDFD